MNYKGMPAGMWLLFRDSFQKALTSELHYSPEEAKDITALARKKYRVIIRHVSPFEKADRFKMNIVSCAMLGAFVLSMPKRPDVKEVTAFYEKAMMNRAMKLFCRIMGALKFSEADLSGMKETAAFKAADRNIYSWNMEFLPFPDHCGYEARFTKCGICTLMKELGLYDLVPAMCHLDYAMAEAGAAADFVRKYTLASGGPYCDCGYRKKEGKQV